MTFTAVASNDTDSRSMIFEFNVTERPSDDRHGVNLQTRAIARALYLSARRGMRARLVTAPNGRPIKVKGV